MSWVSGGELVTGGWVSSNHYGHGVLFENLPTEGDSGASPLLDDGGVNGDEIRWGPATVTSGLITVKLYEDGSFESAGGAGGFSYPWWRNGVLQADESVIIELPITEYVITPESGSFSYTGSSVSLLVNRLITPQAGAYSYTGGAADIEYNAATVTYIITPEPAVYTCTGPDVGLLIDRVLTTASGAYAYTGSAVTIDYSGVVLLLIDGYQIGYAVKPAQLAYKSPSVLLSYKSVSGA
jgi:hypothetical protein